MITTLKWCDNPDAMEYCLGVLSDAEGERFWPAYRDYRAEVMVVQDRYAAMIGSYVKTYEAEEISDE